LHSTRAKPLKSLKTTILSDSVEVLPQEGVKFALQHTGVLSVWVHVYMHVNFKRGGFVENNRFRAVIPPQPPPYSMQYAVSLYYY
jgi:hypothetical protein